MPQTLTRDCLSEHDRQVLDSIFNPLELTSVVDVGQTSSLNPAEADADADLVDDVDEDVSENVQKSKKFEVAAIKLIENAENGVGLEAEQALHLFEQAISAAPQRPSTYNNRAQALRLVGRDDEALEDLNKAIDLAEMELRTKCHALCQRGVLYRRRENLDAARRDFEEAAKMGSKFAKTQLVEINPFAALCNQMLRQAFEQLK